MNESKWICERCGREYDLEEGKGWITLAEDLEIIGKLTSQKPCIFHRFSMIDAYNKFPHVYGLIPNQPEK